LVQAKLSVRSALVTVPLAGLVIGGGLWWSGHGDWSAIAWAASAVPVLAVLIFEIATSIRRGEAGLDIVAALSMTAALAFGEDLAAVVVALMYAGGQNLENFAERRAKREMTTLLDRAPRSAMRRRDGALEEIDLEMIVPGDRLFVRQGDIVPVDGAVASGLAVLDQSALTGESLPAQRAAGEAVISGSVNVGEAFDLSASHSAGESTYAGIIRLVESAQRSKAPMSRLADRYAMAFLAATIVLAGGAWFVTGDPIRAVAVLVVATPCPLILAVPVAIVAGLSRAAKQGILIKGGKALEALTRVRTLVIDKTGTLTDGRARIVSIHVLGDKSADDVLRIAASLDQASKHIIAQTIVSEAHDRQYRLAALTETIEAPGEGIEGVIDDKRVIVGSPRFVQSKLSSPWTGDLVQFKTTGAALVAVAIDGQMAGVLVLADNLRKGTDAFLRDIRRQGIERVVLATGDQREVAEAIVAGFAIDVIRSELSPDQKVMVVLAERKNGAVMMVGDGVNDAPALAAADVGVAMGARGAAAAAEIADVVLLVDDLSRLARGVETARRSIFIALESVYVGIGLSLAGMVAAALGFLKPVEGAVFQEIIDVAVILNALRALAGGAG
jgi:heavy metal translocating P-type ATPase